MRFISLSFFLQFLIFLSFSSDLANHGKLTRAGKVRDHTPFVPKTAKSKTSSARVKIRQLYMRRFVTTAVGGRTPGRNQQGKSGANANIL
jgi:small subunit ribosomal protein S30e